MGREARVKRNRASKTPVTKEPTKIWSYDDIRTALGHSSAKPAAKKEETISFGE